MTTATKAKKATTGLVRTRAAVRVERLSVSDWANGEGLFKGLILGDPSSGKTRWSSAFPAPIYLACEATVGASIVTRKIRYGDTVDSPHVVRITGSDSMFDALEWLTTQKQYRTAVFDTADGYADTLKSEWAKAENAGIFTGREAWSFLEGKMSLTLERLLSLDMNVIILCHLKENQVEEPTNVPGQTVKKTLYEPLLQGATQEKIFRDLNLVGLMKREFVGDTEVRGITFEATPQFPFLKDHFYLEPPGTQQFGRKFWPITLDDGTKGSGDPETFVATNYGALFTAILEGMEGLVEPAVISEIPDASLPSGAGVLPADAPGGPVTPAPAAPKPPAKAAAAKPAAPAAPAAPAVDPKVAEAAAKLAEVINADIEVPEPTPEVEVTVTSGTDVPAQAAVSEPETPQVVQQVNATTGEVRDAPSGAVAETPAVEQAQAPDQHEQAVQTVQETLGGEVIAEKTPAEVNPNGCGVCGKSPDAPGESVDLWTVSRLQHRTLVLPDGRSFFETKGACRDCMEVLKSDKANGTGLYAQAS